MVNVKLRRDGRIVIPRTTREMYALKEGDLLEIKIVRVRHLTGEITKTNSEDRWCE